MLLALLALVGTLGAAAPAAAAELIPGASSALPAQTPPQLLPSELHTPEPPPAEQHAPVPPAGEQHTPELPAAEQRPAPPPPGEQHTPEVPAAEQHPAAPPPGEQHTPEVPAAEQHPQGEGHGGGPETHAAGASSKSEAAPPEQPASSAADGPAEARAQTAPPAAAGGAVIVEGPLVIEPRSDATAAKPVKPPARTQALVATSAGENLTLWPHAQPPDSQPPSGPAAVALSSSPQKGLASADHGRGGVAGDRAPTGPTPGPEPGGSSGGSATGASGLAAPSLLTLAVLLLIGAPAAMRRLRLDCQPFRTTWFALIPERPD
jgi:hypothetical protein